MSQEYLFGLGALRKINFIVPFHIVRVQVPSSGEETGRLNYFASIATRGLLATDHVILNYGQVTWTTPELAPPLLTTTPHQREDVSALDRFNVHRCPTRQVFSGTGLEPVTKQATVRYLYHSATAATKCRPTGIDVSDAHCRAIGTGFESWRRHGCSMSSHRWDIGRPCYFPEVRNDEVYRRSPSVALWCDINQTLTQSQCYWNWNSPLDKLVKSP
ncbi:uncharacterized protein TNCV_2689981 [Trichonephila clavipes]|uniref:Uncharacterized protein n=1 Tax=Trichonephila clavipes TaxID=2585209 RepID=A0A8X6VYM2_TRICX|nr:uncharacterized protein TNCV_2689981 [Trichonephila clavipes]